MTSLDPLLHWADGMVMTLSDYLDYGLAQDRQHSAHRARMTRLKTFYARRRRNRR